MDARSALDVWATLQRQRMPVPGNRRQRVSGDYLSAPATPVVLEALPCASVVARVERVLSGEDEVPAELAERFGRRCLDELQRFVQRREASLGECRRPTLRVLGDEAQLVALTVEPHARPVAAEVLRVHPRRGPYAVRSVGYRGSDGYLQCLQAVRVELRAIQVERLFEGAA